MWAHSQMVESKLTLVMKESKLAEEDLVLKDEEDYVQCPFDSSHRVYKATEDDHMVISVGMV